MDTQSIIDNHMKYRCACIAMMCVMSTYDWITHSLYEPITTDRWNVSGVNILFSLAYLIWDTWAMVGGVNKKILYRQELLIHHVVSFCIFSYGGYGTPLVVSRNLLCESLSLLNYILRHNEYVLHMYRLTTIFFVRIPICCFHILFYRINPHLLDPSRTVTGVDVYVYKLSLLICHLFFITYDVILVRKILGIMWKKKMI
jgi:hypothetical protein